MSKAIVKLVCFGRGGDSAELSDGAHVGGWRDHGARIGEYRGGAIVWE